MIQLHDIDPILFSLGPLQIHWYGLMYGIGFLVAWLIGSSRVRAGRLPGVDEDGFASFMIAMIAGVLLGGRIGYVLFYSFDTFAADPLSIIKIWEGGMSFHGGLIGVLIAAWVWKRKRTEFTYWDLVDFVAPLVPAGLGLGRLGNFINGELWGKYTGGDWGVIFPSDPELSGYTMAQLRQMYAAGQLDAFARHPSQLYQAFLEGLVLFTVLYVVSRRPRRRFLISGLFALGYGLARFAVEFVRVPDAQLGYLGMGWLTMGQLLSLPLILLGIGLIILSRTSPVLEPKPVEPGAGAGEKDGTEGQDDGDGGPDAEVEAGSEQPGEADQADEPGGTKA
ncbi:prolipoprotein diacylglyceryl transferase [Parenemella sanctibonifatiensis]|uniref:Phosphatidylglycerol--prolipoprotein diacylglyceryl transferase n=1 Tax=Parenemella sanctibonifatiensis TaxID=2016505 RepID=A0A255ED72_9ACTN|nr:prolipoprotein diacylglyceryl transferase [Parenemella sanctibonifatiensis]OYN89486.1 prolipoprotein diacylglyceryl transferase [Parenemella sanctibonifatiensis]